MEGGDGFADGRRGCFFVLLGRATRDPKTLFRKVKVGMGGQTSEDDVF
jgi:hypothetical protein